MLVGGVRLWRDADQPMSQAIPVAIAQILSKAEPQDSFALLTVGGPRKALPFGSSQDAIRAAGDQLRKAKWERGGKGVLDALVEAASWFGSPQVGDSIILFGGAPNEGAARISQLRTSLAAGHIRLLVFSGSASTTTGGGLTEGTWVRPLARICDETGGTWEEAGFAGVASTDQNVKLWQAEAEGLYENIRSIYLLRLERTGPDIEIGLAPKSFGLGAWEEIHYPKPLLVCP